MRFFLAALFCLNATGATLLDLQPVRFEPNPHLGQKTSPVKWSARGPGFAFLFGDDLTMIRTSAGTAKLTFPGSNPSAKFAGDHPLSARINYFHARDYAGVTAYTRLKRASIYPGIDLVYYGTGHDIEYDFEIAPNADASQIRMRFDGADSIHLNDAGEIVLKFENGEITQRKPSVYQRLAKGRIASVEASYTLDADGTARVELANYDRTAALVVDPSITYMAYLQGSQLDTVVSIGHDAQGRVYMAGNTYSPDFPATQQAEGITLNGIQNVWVMQLDPTLGGSAIVYCSYLAGEATDTALQMTVDSSGVMYVVGNTDSGTYPVTSSAYLGTYSGNFHAFVSMVDPSQYGANSLIYSTFFGGSNFDYATAVTVAVGKIYVAGYTNSTDLPTVNPYQSALVGAFDSFVAEFDPVQSGAASLVACTYLGGSYDDKASAIAIDPTGLVYVAGQTFSFDFPTTSNADQPGYAGAGDIFLSVLNLATSTLPYSSYFGGSNEDDVKKIVLTSGGLVGMTGYTISPDFPVTLGAFQTNFGGNGNAFLATINTNAAPGLGTVYCTYFGGSGGEVAYDLRLDSAGLFYLGGYTLSPNLPVTSNALYPSSVGGSVDGFLAIIDASQPPFSSKQLIFSTYITGQGTQIVYGVDVDTLGMIYVTGITTANIFPNQLPPNTFVLKTSAFLLNFTLP
jgi:Beta-propeller repeat